MIGIIITLAAFCIILICAVYFLCENNNALSSENGLLKGRMEATLDGSVITNQAAAHNNLLTVEDIEAAVRHAGFVTETVDGFVSFRVEGKRIDIDTSRLPIIDIVCDYSIDRNTWDMELLKTAAHLMSDDIIMVKALIDDSSDNASLRLLLVAADHNYLSFRDNLVRYIKILRNGSDCLREKYHNLEQEKNQPTQAATPLLTFRYGA